MINTALYTRGVWPDKPRVLFSYAYLDTIPADTDVVIDSGAFTAATKGTVIDIDAYTSFLASSAHRFTFALSLDVIGDWRASAVNYDRQRAMLDGVDGVTLVPTWHVGSPPEELHRLCAATDYVAIGGCVPYRNRPAALLRLMVYAHRAAAQHGTRLHGLGITSAKVMRLPWTSVDSSSWTIARRHPLIYLAKPGGALRSISRGQTLKADDADLIRRYGLNPSLVSDRMATRRDKTLLTDYTEAMCRSYMEVERWGHHPKVYLAVGSLSDMDVIRAAHRRGSALTHNHHGR